MRLTIGKKFEVETFFVGLPASDSLNGIKHVVSSDKA